MDGHGLAMVMEYFLQFKKCSLLPETIYSEEWIVLDN